MLFNDSIMNNIRYARITASDKEVYEACKAAAVHEKIMSFPDGTKSYLQDTASCSLTYLLQATTPRSVIVACKFSYNQV